MGLRKRLAAAHGRGVRDGFLSDARDPAARPELERWVYDAGFAEGRRSRALHDLERDGIYLPKHLKEPAA